MNVRITQLDGALPNLALMKLAHWHKARGDAVTVTRRIERDIFESAYDRVYGSAIFSFSQDRVDRFATEWPGAILGGTGVVGSTGTVEQWIGADEYEHYDYEGYPGFDESIGFTQRGCRLKCKFCVVPAKEGKNRSVNTIADIWRGEGFPKKLHILDNDFFGQPAVEWRARIYEIRDGVERLERAGIPPKQLMVYMLVGYDPFETWERIWHRFNRMVELGVMPYPMVYEKRNRPDLRAFQRWVITGLYRAVPFEAYDRARAREKLKHSDKQAEFEQ